MKKQVVYIIIIATLQMLFVCAANAQTLTVKTDPEGLDVWVGSELIGESPVYLQGPFEKSLTVSVIIGADILETIVSIPDDRDTELTINTRKGPKSANRKSITSVVGGVGVGLSLSIVIILVLNSLVSSAFEYY